MYKKYAFSEYGLPKIVCGVCVAVCQLLFKNMCLSILVGTALYVIWINKAAIPLPCF